MRALVIEDHPRMSALLRQGLEEEGYAVDAAQTLLEGMSLANEYEFDAIVLDVMLPDGDGIDALLELLMRRAGQVVPRSTLMEHGWDFAFEGDWNILEVYVRYLREKVDRPFGRDSIETVRGVGYRLRSSEAASS